MAESKFRKIADTLNCTKCLGGIETNRPILGELMKETNCPLHDGREFELFCETCGELICSRCVFRGQKHNTHKYDLISACYDRYKNEIATSLAPMDQQLLTITRALGQIDTSSGEVADQQSALGIDIQNTTKRLHDILDVRKSELTSQLEQVTQSKLVSLANQKAHLDTTQTQLSGSLDLMRESLKTGSQGEVLMMRQYIVRQVDELTAKIHPDSLKPDAEADATFTVEPQITSVCQNFGDLLLQKSLDPSKFCVNNDSLQTALVGEKTTLTLTTINFMGELYEKHMQSLEYELVSELTGATLRGSIGRRRHSEYEINYQPTVKGKHKLHVKYEGQPIRGSPFDVIVTLPVEKLGVPLGTLDGVQDPFAIAITSKGSLVVVERSGHCVSVVNPAEKTRKTFGTRGTGPGQFSDPYGICVDGEGNIVVGDHVTNCIQKFSSDGVFLTSAGSKGTGPLQFTSHKSIAYNSHNNKIYVVDENRIQVLHSNLTYSSSFGKEGSGKGQFSSPWGIACDNTGKVYVADSRNHRIQVFTSEGKFIRMIGKGNGETKTELNWPAGIAVDDNGILYVADNDSNNTRVSVFTCEGRFVTAFGKKGKDLGDFNDPHGIAVDSCGIVYVCDYGNSRVQFF